MSELTKQQLTVENNSSFPNNNTGFITPTLLRTFNGNIIDSMVDEVTYNADSASWTSDITQLEQFSASLNTNFVTPTQLSASSSTLQNNINTKLNTSSFNAYTASQSGVATGSLLLTASAVSNIITFTKGDGSTFPVTVGSVIDSSSLVSTSSFNAYTQSAAANTSASINSATSSLSASLTLTDNSKLNTSSFNSYTASASTNVSASINAATQSLSASLTTTINGISGKTGSYATTGSNTFIGNQIISGNLNVSGNITATSASFQYVQTIYETASVIYSSGSNQFGDASDDTQTLFGRVDVKTGPLVITGSTFVSGNITLAQGSDLVTHHIKAAAVNGVEIQNNSGNTAILVGAGGSLGTTFYGQINTTAISSSGNITGNLLGTASYANKALTASYAENVTPTDVSMFVSQSVFNSYTASASSNVSASINSATGSSIVTASISGDTITFTKGNGSTFPIVVPSGGSGSIDTGSFATTGSNTFKDTQTIDLSATAILTASAIIGNADKVITDMYVNGGNYDTFNVLVSASNGVFLRDFNGVDTTPFLSVDTNGGNVRIPRNTNLTGSLIVSGGFNAKVAFPLINNTNNILQSTGSIIVAQDIVRSGGGANDVASLRLQARTGSAGAGDALTSTISAQNNLNTTTFLSASAVASLQATFSTGSGGGTVGYNAGLTATAQSGSAISVLSGNTIRLGTSAANVITSTGSFGPMVLAGTLNQPVLSIRSGSVEVTTPQGSGSFYTNLPITSSNGRINGEFIVKDLIVSGTWGGSGSGSLSVENRFVLSGSMTLSSSGVPTIAVTGSYAGNNGFSGSVITNLGDTYTSTAEARNIVTLDSASMATLISGATTNANTLYFVI